MRRSLTAMPLTLALLACGKGGSDDSSTASGTGGGTAGGTASGSTAGTDLYEFPSRFGTGSSVSHGGQSARQLLITDLKAWLGGVTGRVDAGFFPVPGEVAGELDFYFSFDGASAGSVPFLLATTPPAAQATYGELSTSANLVSKIAGNDAVGQHEDWSTALVGWDDPAVTTPESLVRHWFAAIDAAAVDRSNGVIPLGADGEPLAAVYLTPEGQDLQQLLEKFLHGAVSFSQAADDYLDDDEPGKGLLSGNTDPEDGAAYTALEHGWDEGFAYFGAAHDYARRSDADLAASGALDAGGDGAVDLLTEMSWGASVNAAKRDDGAVAATDFTGDAWDGFHAGRALITDAGGELDAAQLEALRGHRDQAIEAWEQVIAATVVHYVNEVLVDMGRFGTPDYVFADHAKHWSEMKGFAMAFQFNPRSPIADPDFAALHDLLRQAPVLPADGPTEIADYRADLLEARARIGAAYGFDAANLGDDDGLGGW